MSGILSRRQREGERKRGRGGVIIKECCSRTGSERGEKCEGRRETRPSAAASAPYFFKKCTFVCFAGERRSVRSGEERRRMRRSEGSER